MADIPSGASAHLSPSRLNPQTPAQHAPATSRNRRLHGVFSLAGEQAAAIYSTRRGSDPQPVTLEIGIGSHRLASPMTPSQARAVARTLMVAAEAGEFVQRQRSQSERAVAMKGGAQ